MGRFAGVTMMGGGDMASREIIRGAGAWETEFVRSKILSVCSPGQTYALGQE
jgi:hypothetical protein